MYDVYKYSRMYIYGYEISVSIVCFLLSSNLSRCSQFAEGADTSQWFRQYNEWQVDKVLINIRCEMGYNCHCCCW